MSIKQTWVIKALEKEIEELRDSHRALIQRVSILELKLVKRPVGRPRKEPERINGAASSSE
jgi:hypothetical protein